MPSDGIISLDNGLYKIWFARNYRAHEPNTILLDNSLASIEPTMPAPLTRRGVVFRMAREVMFFESLFKSNKWIWLFGYIFHASLLLVVLRHLRYFTEPVWGWVELIQPVRTIHLAVRVPHCVVMSGLEPTHLNGAVPATSRRRWFPCWSSSNAACCAWQQNLVTAESRRFQLAGNILRYATFERPIESARE